MKYIFFFSLILLFLTSCKQKTEEKHIAKQKKDSIKVFTKLSALKNTYIGFNSQSAINKIAKIENEYFNNRKKTISQYYGTAWRGNAETNFENDNNKSVYDQYVSQLIKERQIKPDSMHCTIYAIKALQAGLGESFAKLENHHKIIWKNREYAGWSVAYILTKYFDWRAILILSKKSPEYTLCIKNFKRDKKYHVYKQPDIPIEKVLDFDDDKRQIDSLLSLQEFGWGFSHQGWHTWITRYNKLKECNWEGTPSTKYTSKNAKPLFIKTKFTEFYDYDSHVIVFPPKRESL